MFNSIAATYFKKDGNLPLILSPLFLPMNENEVERKSKSKQMPGSQGLYEGSPFQPQSSTSSIGTNTSVNFRDKGATSASLAPEAEWVSKFVTVVQTQDLLEATFGKEAVAETQAAASVLKGVFAAKKSSHKRKWKLEKDMYSPITDAFNECCQGTKISGAPSDNNHNKVLECIDIHSKRYSLAPEVAFKSKIGPDLCLTFDAKSIEGGSNPCDFPAILIELKVHGSADLSRGVGEVGSKPTQAQQDLLCQVYGYVAYGQYPSHPHRFCWSITICNDKLRIGRWTSTGVVMTEAIDYLKDATVVAQFVRLIASGSYLSLGLDIGPGMTFSSFVSDEKTKHKLHAVVNTYYQGTLQHIADQRWCKQAQDSPTLLFQPGDSTDGDSLLVISHPLSWTLGIFGRSTRVYVAASRKHVEDSEVIDLKHLHTLKMSWQYTSRIPEYVTFEMAKARNKHKPIACLATMMSGGEITSTRQRLGLFEVPELPPQGSQGHGSCGLINDKKLLEVQQTLLFYGVDDPSPVIGTHSRTLQWVLFKEVGRRLCTFKGVRQLVQVLTDAVKAHQSLHQVNILHRDISEGNVLIDLRTGRGLLIDLDMAEDLEPLEQPGVKRLAITGTRRFMSVALHKLPTHRFWHDIESIFWVLVYITLKHVDKACLVDELGTERERISGLNLVYPDHPTPFQDANAAKRKFLREFRVKTEDNAALARLIQNVGETFRSLHEALDRAHQFRGAFEELKHIAELHEYPQAILSVHPHAIQGLDELRQYQAQCELAMESLKNAPFSDEVRGKLEDSGLLETLSLFAKRLATETASVKYFPTYEYFLDQLEPLCKGDSKLEASDALDYEALLAKEAKSCASVDSGPTTNTARHKGSTASRKASRSPPTSQGSGIMTLTSQMSLHAIREDPAAAAGEGTSEFVEEIIIPQKVVQAPSEALVPEEPEIEVPEQGGISEPRNYTGVIATANVPNEGVMERDAGASNTGALREDASAASQVDNSSAKPKPRTTRNSNRVERPV